MSNLVELIPHFQICADVFGCKKTLEDCSHKSCHQYFSCEALSEKLLARETAILNDLENALSQTESCSACRGCGFYAHQISDNECERRVCELCSGSGRMQVPNVDEALSIIQRRKGGK